MNLQQLQNDNVEVARTYALKKFIMFMKLKEGKREQKVAQYYDAVRYMPKHARVVAEAYTAVYHKPIDDDRGPVGYHLDVIGRDLQQLKDWESNGDWQEGEDFLRKLKELMLAYDVSACEDNVVKKDFGVQAKKAMTGSGVLTSEEVGGEFDAMLGLQQTASLSFVARTDMGELTAKLEESLKLGAWAQGQAAAKMSAAGMSAEMQFTAAVGGELNIDGMMSWSKGDAALKLGGNVKVFGGARGSVGLKLSAESKGKFEASIEAGCFAGLEISCSGDGAFIYADEEVLSAAAELSLKLGVGAQFAASYASSIFGPTEVALDMGVAMGIGMGSSATVAVSFAAMHLLGKDAFRTVLYLPTLAQGYKMELMTNDSKNRYFLKRSQAKLVEEIAAVRKVMAKGGSDYVRLY